VNFEHGNLLQERFRFGSGPYNFIFCRNLLIYFYSEAQGQALKNLAHVFTVQPVGGRGKTSYLRARKVVNHAPITRPDSMVRLVDYQQPYRVGGPLA